MKKLKKLGKLTSKPEIHTSAHGVWLFVHETEYFLSYKEYPWFKKATLAEVYNVKLMSADHLRWPDLDVDLEIESLEHPEKYPLVYK